MAITMEKLRDAGIPAELSAMIIELSRLANRPPIAGKQGDPGKPGADAKTTTLTDAAAFDNYVPAPGELVVLVDG